MYTILSKFLNDNPELPVFRAAYSDRAAWIMATLSEIAYTRFEDGEYQQERLGKSLDAIGFNLKAKFDSQGTQGILVESDKMAVLAFRGTECKTEDILSDLKFRFYKGKHQGFSDAYQQVASDVKDAVKKITGVPLYITGHSLGAAIAVIATHDLLDAEVAACYTFGSPRVCNAEFNDSIKKTPVYRVVNASDIVTRVPFSAMGFVHTGDLRYLTSKGKLLRSPNLLRRFGRFIKNVFRSKKSMVKNHMIMNYINKLMVIAIERS